PCDPLALTPFPTRRSSDLSTYPAKGQGTLRMANNAFPRPITTFCSRRLARGPRSPVFFGFRQHVHQAPCLGRLSEPKVCRLAGVDRKSTRLNSSHRTISYA